MSRIGQNQFKISQIFSKNVQNQSKNAQNQSKDVQKLTLKILLTAKSAGFKILMLVSKPTRNEVSRCRNNSQL